jgi:hypothetical protein
MLEAWFKWCSKDKALNSNPVPQKKRRGEF